MADVYTETVVKRNYKTPNNWPLKENDRIPIIKSHPVVHSGVTIRLLMLRQAVETSKDSHLLCNLFQLDWQGKAFVLE